MEAVSGLSSLMRCSLYRNSFVFTPGVHAQLLHFRTTDNRKVDFVHWRPGGSLLREALRPTLEHAQLGGIAPYPEVLTHLLHKNLYTGAKGLRKERQNAAVKRYEYTAVVACRGQKVASVTWR